VPGLGDVSAHGDRERKSVQSNILARTKVVLML